MSDVISHAEYVLYFYICTFQSICLVPSMAVLCTALISCFTGILRRNYLSDFQIVPVASINTGITFALNISALNLYCKDLYILGSSQVFFLIIFLSPETAASINIHVPFSLSRIIMSGLLLGIVLSVCT